MYLIFHKPGTVLLTKQIKIYHVSLFETKISFNSNLNPLLSITTPYFPERVLYKTTQIYSCESPLLEIIKELRL